jgi:kynurenine 3-monooxygenase
LNKAEEKIAVVGGGLVGSLFSLYLAQRGHDVSVFERRSDPRKAGFIGGRSINLALSDRGWKALEMVNMAEAVKKMALPMKGRMMHAKNGTTTFQPYGKEGQAIYSVSRGGLNKLLLEAADEHKDVSLHFDHQCKQLDLKTNRATFAVGEKKEVLQFDRIIGTDGAFSAVRSRLMKTERFNYSQKYLTHGYKELVIPAKEDGTHRLDPEALHIWPREEFMLIALPNLDGSFTVTLFLAFEGEISFKSIEASGNPMVFFEEHFPTAIKWMPNLLQDYNDNPTPSLVMISCYPWHFEDKVCLMGDASHAIVPFYGQGMNSGFEDCSVFNDLFEEAGGDWGATFEAFSKKRFPEAEAIRELALRNYIEMRDKTADPMFLLQKKIEKRFSQLHPELWTPLYSQVTFSHIPYDTALANGEVQDQIMKAVMDRPDIHDVWESDEMEKAILKAIGR